MVRLKLEASLRLSPLLAVPSSIKVEQFHTISATEKSASRYGSAISTVPPKKKRALRSSWR